MSTPPNNTISRDKTSGGKNGKGGMIINLIILLVAVVAFSWLFINYREAKQQIAYLSTPGVQQEIAEQEVNNLIFEVAKLINLPEGEQPTVATIQDVEALSEQQPFFLGAENGDKILIYQNKAIIYSPTTQKLINVGPVYVNQQSENIETEDTEE